MFVSDLCLTVVVSPGTVGELDIFHQDGSYRYQWPLWKAVLHTGRNWRSAPPGVFSAKGEWSQAEGVKSSMDWTYRKH